jgi:hypothetical protein
MGDPVFTIRYRFSPRPFEGCSLQLGGCGFRRLPSFNFQWFLVPEPPPLIFNGFSYRESPPSIFHPVFPRVPSFILYFLQRGTRLGHWTPRRWGIGPRGVGALDAPPRPPRPMVQSSGIYRVWGIGRGGVGALDPRPRPSAWVGVG